MKSLFVMDPLEALHVEGDSTYTTMLECTERGYPVWYCTPGGLFARDGRAQALATPVITHAREPWFETGEPVDLYLDDVDVVWMRKDPPFDMDYIFSTYVLDMTNTKVVNDPAGLKLFNEKMWAMKDFSRFQPPTLLSADRARIKAFAREQGTRIVLKPWDGNGGRGVLITDATDRNLASMIDVLTEMGRRYLIAQRFIEEVEQGDKRILLFDGEPVGAMLRVPQKGDYRANMHVGATVEATELGKVDREICDALRPVLKKWGQVFVGIDVIDRYLTEINVTSPTGIRELNRLYGTKLQSDLVDTVERLVRQETA